ncbi:YetF domain-containing protein [Anaerosolibacter sp.]|uniref:YetF domain-containing protein n=1 Tax=Anaerosolibacter sp. TaxID=1872527 RepID=UPI0039EFF42A
MQAIINPAIRTVIAYFVLLILSRIMGRKMISQMTFFDFAVGITIGSVTANLALGPYNSIRSGVTVLIALTGLVVLLDFLHIKSFRFRKIIDSEPIVAIKNGQIIDDNLRKERFTIDELMMLLRQKNIFSIADVEFAVLEYDGKLSVLPKSQKQPLTPSDINVTTPYKGLTKDIIYDGNILEENFTNTQYNKTTLMNQLKMQGINDVSEVFYAGIDSTGSLCVSKKYKDKEKQGQYGIE